MLSPDYVREINQNSVQQDIDERATYNKSFKKHINSAITSSKYIITQDISSKLVEFAKQPVIYDKFKINVYMQIGFYTKYFDYYNIGDLEKKAIHIIKNKMKIIIKPWTLDRIKVYYYNKFDDNTNCIYVYPKEFDETRPIDNMCFNIEMILKYPDESDIVATSAQNKLDIID